VDGFFEWKAIRGQKAKQPYAIAMKDGAPFGIAGIWENWKEPAFGGMDSDLRYHHYLFQ
jgi:putative SOS response-associated peptidase YedK